MPRGKSNKMEEPLKRMAQLDGEVAWDDYEHRGKFAFICEAAPERMDEKLVITGKDDSNVNRSCVYAMVIDGRIFKIGSALNGVGGRIGSYNAGRMKYRGRGTNSTTNFWVLQTLINLAKPVRFYGVFPPLRKCEFFGETFREPFPSAKAVEKVVLQRFVDTYGRKPVGCTQG